MAINLKNPGLLKGVLSFLLAGGLLAAFFLTHLVSFSFPNQAEKVNTLKAEYEKKSTELARARAAIADLPRFEAEYHQMHQRWTMAAELLPADKQLPVLLRKMTLAGQQTGVQFMMFRPSTARSENYYTELPVEISVSGGYHQVGSFLAELANMRRIVTVSNVRLSTNTKGDVVKTTSAQFTASAYSLNTTQAAPKPPVKNGQKGEAGNAQKSS